MNLNNPTQLWYILAVSRRRHKKVKKPTQVWLKLKECNYEFYMNKIITVIVLVGFSLNLYSTEQTRDLLVYKKMTIFLYDSPLEEFPELEKMIQNDAKEISSNCWKGYYAEWEIINDSLFLKSIYSCSSNERINKYAVNVLKKSFKNGRIHADWVTGGFFGGAGENYFYYSKEFFFTLQNGVILSSSIYDQLHEETELNDELNINQYIYDNFPWSELNSEEIPELYVAKVVVHVDENGHMETVSIKHGNNANYNSLIIQLLKSRPFWRIYYYKGESMDFEKELELRFTTKGSGLYPAKSTPY